MSTTSAGSPAPAAEAATATPPANAAESSLIEQAKNANTTAALKALREQWMKPAPTPPPAKAPENAPAAPAAEEEPPAEAAPVDGAPASEEEPAPEGAPPATEEGGSEPPAAGAEGGEDDDEEAGTGEGPVTPHGGKRAHLRFAENDEVGRLAASFKQRNRDWTLEQSLQAAKKQLGIKDEQAAGGQQEPAKPKSDLPSTVEDVDSALEQLINQKNAKMVALDFEEVAKIDTAIRKLDRHRVVLEKDAERQQHSQATEYNKNFDASMAKATDLYPFVADPASAGAKRMLEIERQLEENSDPLNSSPDKPLKLAQMVAAELNIAPRKKGAPAPAKVAAPAAPAPNTPKKGMLPSGGSRTTPPPSTQPAIDAEINAIRTVADMRKFRQKHGLPV